MKTNANDPVFCSDNKELQNLNADRILQGKKPFDVPSQLTKLEHFSAMAMQGLMTTLIPLSDNQFVPNSENVEYCAKLAVTAAQTLINELNKIEP